MIQRKQTIWLLVAALASAGVFFFDIYYADITAGGINTVKHLRVNDHFPTLLVALVMTILPFVAVFMFKNRKRQRTMAIVSILANISFISLVMMRVNSLNNEIAGAGEGSYWIASVLPVVAIIFLIMAIAGINKDEKLVRSSYDRLR